MHPAQLDLPTVLAASSGLWQVALGGVVGAGLTLVVTGRREHKRIRSDDLATLRLIEMELGNARRAAQYISAGAPYVALPVSAWEEGRIRLARSLEPSEWLLVAAAYDAIHGFNWRYQHDRELPANGLSTTAPPILALIDKRREFCRDIIEMSTPALEMLKDHR